MKRFKFKNDLIIFLILCFVLIHSISYAYRPFNTEDAGVAGNKVFQIEASYDYMDWDTGNKDNILLFVAIYGLNKKTEISLELPFTKHIHFDNTKTQGLNDANVVVKYQFVNLEKQNTLLTLKTFVKLNNGNTDKGFGSGDKDYSFALALSKEFPKFLLHSHLGYSFVGDAGDSNIQNIHLYGLGIDYKLNDQFCLIGEISGQKHPDKTAESDPTSYAFGLIYKKNENQIFDFAVRKGLTNSSPKLNLTLGCSLTF